MWNVISLHSWVCFIWILIFSLHQLCLSIISFSLHQHNLSCIMYCFGIELTMCECSPITQKFWVNTLILGCDTFCKDCYAILVKSFSATICYLSQFSTGVICSFFVCMYMYLYINKQKQRPTYYFFIHLYTSSVSTLPYLLATVWTSSVNQWGTEQLE